MISHRFAIELFPINKVIAYLDDARRRVHCGKYILTTDNDNTTSSVISATELLVSISFDYFPLTIHIIQLSQTMPETSIAKLAEPFVCGGSAATFASVIIHPMDLAKVRMQLYGQMNPGKPVPSFPEILSKMIKSDGVSSVYKGVDAAIGRQLVYGTARIGLHRAISDKLKEANEGKPISFLMKTLSGMASGSIAVCIGTPCE